MENAITVLRAFGQGKEVLLEGNTYVWLDNHVVSETETHQNVIDGLAIKARRFKAGQDIDDPEAGTDYYMGMGDISIGTFAKMCENMPEKDMQMLKLGVAYTTVMLDRSKKRNLKEV